MLVAGKAKMIIASDGPYRSNLEALARSLGIRDRIKFTGYIPHDALMEYYKLADSFIMASRTETQGIVLLEAAQSGLPSVVLAAPVIANFTRKNGIGLVATEKEFSSRVERMLTDRKLREKILKNCKKIIGRYSIEHCTDLLLDVYKKAVQTKDRTRKAI